MGDFTVYVLVLLFAPVYEYDQIQAVAVFELVQVLAQ